MSEITKKAFWEQGHVGLGEAKDCDDFLHPQLSVNEPGYALTETHYLGFNIPEHDIHGIGYMWYHPNLKTVMGGISVWQGFKKHSLQSEIWDYISYMSDDCLKDDLWHYRLDNGYDVTTIQPLVSHRIKYENLATDSFIDVSLQAITPPIMSGSGLHFEQPMKTKAFVRLRGVLYEGEGVTVRDRSFGQLRKEIIVPLPPLAWMNAVFPDGFCFGCTAFDDPLRKPEWVDEFRLPDDNPLRDGWTVKDGKASQIVKASKRTTRKPGTLYPDVIELEIVDALQRKFEITGKSVAGNNWRTWQNMDSNVNLVRWECGREITHGDYQELLWPEYITKFHP